MEQLLQEKKQQMIAAIKHNMKELDMTYSEAKQSLIQSSTFGPKMWEAIDAEFEQQ